MRLNPGQPLKPQALAVKVGGRHVGEVTEMSIRAANIWFDELPKTSTGKIQKHVLRSKAKG